jgi:hypothetical protein
LPEPFSSEVACWSTARRLRSPWAARFVPIYVWATNGEELGDGEVESLRSAVIPATGQTPLDYLIELGMIRRETTPEVYGAREAMKCGHLCVGRGPHPPTPPIKNL